MVAGFQIVPGIILVVFFLCLVFYNQIEQDGRSSSRRLASKAQVMLQDFKRLRESAIPKEDEPAKWIPTAAVPKASSTGAIINKVTYMYIAGADGAGVEFVSTAIATIGKACGNHVVFRNNYLKSSRYKARSASFISYMKSTKTSNYGPTKKVLVLEEGTFPSENVLVNSTVGEKKLNPRYDIEWIHDYVKLAGGIEQRYLYINRDFYRMVASRAVSTDEEFESRMHSLNAYIQYLSDEERVISTKSPGLWRQINYEWFTDMSNCTALVSAVIDFAGWDRCDVDFACQMLPTPPVDEDAVDEGRAELAALHTLNVTIPLLDITGQTQYQFRNVVSDRKTAKFAAFNESLARSTPSGARPSPRRPATAPHDVVDRWYNFSGPARNTLNFLYIVGVEGTGHHGVTPAVASIAKTCNYHVIYENTALRKAQSKFLPRTYRSSLNAYRQYDYKTTTKVLILEDQSFPTDGERRNSTQQQKKSSGKYNLEWIYDQAVATGMDLRFLYLQRDFYRSVASHIEFDGTFERHAQVLHDFIWYIDAESQRISAKQPGLWTTIHYEWFRHMSNCTALVSAVIDFAGWDQCDVDFACQMLRQTLRNTTHRPVNATDYAFAQSLNVNISIPQLNISEHRNYSFNNVVSARTPFTFIFNMTNSRASRYRLARQKFSVGRYSAAHSHSAAMSDADGEGGGASSSLNNLTMIYLAGVRGAGHVVAAHLLITVAESCHHHVITENRALRRAQSKLLFRSYRSVLSSFQHAIYPDTDQVVLVDGFPLYADGERPTGTPSEKRSIGRYNLAWLHNRAQDAGMRLLFLYLKRPFLEVLATSYNATEPFAVHAQSTYAFVQYIGEERERVEEKEAGLWAQLDYAWLTNPKHCPALVQSLMEFARWNGCNVTQACAQYLERTAAERATVVPLLTAANTVETHKYSAKVDLAIPMLNFTTFL